jgi:hypothetical protein
MTSHLLTLCFVLTAHGTDLAPPLLISSESAHEAPTNVSAYPTTQSATKSVADLTGSAILPCKPRDYPQGDFTLHVLLATTPRSPPPDVQRNPNLCTDHADPAQNICFAEDEPALTSNELVYPDSHACHGTDTSSDIDKFMKRLLTCLTDGPKKDAKPEKWWMLILEQKRIWIIATKKDAPANMCGNGPELFYTTTSTCPTPVYHSNIPLSFCCELLYVLTLILITMSLIVSTTCAFGLAKAFDKLRGVKIPSPLLFIFLTLFPAPGVAATQGLVNQRSTQVAVYTNTSASTSMVAVDTVASWAQLVTVCGAAPSANITLSPAFKMGAYTNEIDFR